MTAGAYSVQRVRKNLLYFLTGKTLSGIIGFLILMLLVRALTPSDYGFFIVLLALFEVLQLASSIGCYPAAYRYVPELNTHGAEAQLRRFIGILLAIRASTLFFTAVVVSLGASWIFGWLGFENAESVPLFYAIFLLFEGINRYVDQLYDALMLQGYSQVSILMRNGARLCCLLFFVFPSELGTQLTIELWLMVEAGASVFGLAVAGFLLLWALPGRGGHGNIRSQLDLQRLLAYVAPAYGAQLAWLAQGPDVVKMLIARLTDSIQVGAFGFCAALNTMLQRYLPVFLLIGMVRPIFVSAREQGRTHEELVSLASLVLKLNLFLLFPLLSIVALTGNELVVLLSGGAFPNAGAYLTLFVVLLIFQSLHTILGLLAMVQEQGKAMLNAVLWGTVGIIAGLAGSTVFGPLALAVGLILSELIRCLVVYLHLHRTGLTFVTEWHSLGKMAVVSIVSAAISLAGPYWLHMHGNQSIFATLLMMMAFYIGLSFLIKPFIEQERALINRLLPRPFFVF